MKNKKILIYYFLEFLLAILVFLTIIILILKVSIFNKDYLKNQLVKNNYYHELFIDIQDGFSNYIMQSGFDIEITDNLFTEEDLKKVINNNMDNFYKGQQIIVDTENIKNKLENNINNYLNNKSIIVNDQEALELFKEEITNIYRDRIIISNYLNNISNTFYKINKVINLLFILFLIIDIILFVVIKLLFKKITLTIPILTSMFLLLITYYIIFGNININNIIFWNNYISSVIKSFFKDISNLIKYVGIIGIILEFVKLLIIKLKIREI